MKHPTLPLAHGWAKAIRSKTKNRKNDTNMKIETKATLGQIGDLMLSLREADNVHFDVCASLCAQIVALLTTLREAGETRETCFETLEKWNKNTADGVEIRSRKTLNNWLREAGFRARAERSDKGTVKSDAKEEAEEEAKEEAKEETKEQAILRIKSLMALHGIKVSDLK